MTSKSGTLRASSSWLGSLGQPSAFEAKFSTFAVTGNKPSPRRKVGPGSTVFQEDESLAAGVGKVRSSGERDSLDDELRDLRGLVDVAEQGWSITIAEGPKARSRSRKPDPVLTIYVSTPTSSLTLTRKLSEVVDFEARLRSHFPGQLPNRKPVVPPTTPKKRNTVLASLTRTLSPRRGSSGGSSFTSFGTTSRDALALPTPPSSVTAMIKDLASTLTAASLDASIRSHAAWQAFFAARRDDLESARVERRIKRARSDQTMHLSQGVVSASPLRAFGAEAPHEARPEEEEPFDRGETDRLERQEASTATATSVSVSATSTAATESTAETDVEQVDESVEPLHITLASAAGPTEDVKITAEEPGDASAGFAVVAEDGGADPNGMAPMDTSGEVTPGDIPFAPTADLASSDAQRRDTAVPADAALSPEIAPPPAPAAAPPSSRPVTPVTPTKTAHKNNSKATSAPASLRPPAAGSMTRSMSNASAATTISRKSRAITLDSFDVLRVLGKGCAGKVLLVKKKGTNEHYALKAITKRHVLAHRELTHTRTEQAVLKTCAKDQSNPFVVKLHYSFRDQDTLYLALDFHPGGDLATQLARWGRLGRDRARFYISEILEGVAGLHRAGIIYRDLKPENVLISADGHIVLTDFGLSKDFGHGRIDGLPRPHWLEHPSRSASSPPADAFFFKRRETTTSFCGTAEYLAPEVLLGKPYSYEVDIWSAGTMLYEMLSGMTPFWANDHASMYRRVLHDDLTFDDSLQQFDSETKALCRGMLQRDPLLRISHARILKHPYFRMISWDFIRQKRYMPPLVPVLNPDNPADTSHFDDMFLSLPAEVKGNGPADEAGGERDPPEGEPQEPFDEQGKDVFDGYSYYGRDSASIHRHELEDDDGHLDSSSEDEADEQSDRQDDPTAHADSLCEIEAQKSDAVSIGDDNAVAAAEISPTQRSTAGMLPSTGDEAGSSSRRAVGQDGSAMPLSRGPLSSSAPPVSTPGPQSASASTSSSAQAQNAQGAPAATLPDHVGRIQSPPTTPLPRCASPAKSLNQTTDAVQQSGASGASSSLSLAAVRSRQLSSRSNLEPLPEQPPATHPTDIVVEEAEDLTDDEWDVVDREVGGFVRNGGREATLWQRGVRDKYRLVLAPLASPLRQATSLRTGGSRQTSSRIGSMSSAQSSWQVSPATTPEPPASPRPNAMRRLTSMRSSSNTDKGFLRSRASQGSLDAGLYAAANGIGTRTAPSSPRIGWKSSKRSLAPSTTSSDAGELDGTLTPRKAGFKKLAKSAFLSGGSKP
ncbi:uncharacterized protein JCM10292_002499 [Rhodotorula paludigena]|uniref:uncharacterized protein n=1 Tax=Rhodotorula paludigena TaxID=86838 RepID=UPI003171187E